MPFRFWFYLGNVGSPVLFATVVATYVFTGHPCLLRVRFVGLCLLAALAVSGAVMGILMVLGRLRMRCPFCGRSGTVGSSKRDGLWMECESCGFVHGGGTLHLKIVREGFDKDAG